MFLEDMGTEKDVLPKQRRSKSLLERVAGIFQRRDSAHLHKFGITHRATHATFKKGKREKVSISGDVEKCSCGESRFIPSDKNLAIVSCEKI